MRIELGSWNFRQKPVGVWRRVLRFPVHLYRWHLGFLLGDRFVLIDHVGRNSGRRYQTPVEVVVHDRDSAEYIVCSGTGAQADWYRNLRASPAPAVQVGRRRWRPHQRMLGQQEAAERFKVYEDAHPRTAGRLLRAMGNSYDGTDAGRMAMMADMPMVAFSERARGRSQRRTSSG